MLYLIGIQRPVGNPPGCGNDCIFSGYNIIYYRRIRRPDIICGKILLEISLVIPLVQLGQSGLDPLVNTSILQCPVFIIPAVRPCLISVEEGLEIRKLCIHVILAGRDYGSADLAVAVIINLHQLITQSLELLDCFWKLVRGGNPYAFQLRHIINHLGGHLRRIRAHRQSVDSSVFFRYIDEISVIIENVVQIITTVLLIILGQIRKAALACQIFKIIGIYHKYIRKISCRQLGAELLFVLIRIYDPVIYQVNIHFFLQKLYRS